MAGGVVADDEALIERAHMHVEAILGDIDTDEDRGCVHHHVPSLQLRGEATGQLFGCVMAGRGGATLRVG